MNQHRRCRPLGDRSRRVSSAARASLQGLLLRPKLIGLAVTISKMEGIVGVIVATATSRHGTAGPRPQQEGQSHRNCEVIRELLTAIEHLHQTVMSIGGVLTSGWGCTPVSPAPRVCTR